MTAHGGDIGAYQMLYQTNEDDAFDERGLLKDGHVARVRMTMRDAMRMRERSQIHDGRGGPLNMAGHRPGFLLSDSNKRAIQPAYMDHENYLQNAWKRDAAPPGSYPYRPDLEGSGCTVDGRPGVLVRSAENSDWLVCQPTKQSFSGSNNPEPASDSVRDHRRRMAELYAARDAEDANAWRGNK
jgi:hypothetical protein